MCQQHGSQDDTQHPLSTSHAARSTPGGQAVRCPRCGVQFSIDADGSLDQLVAAVQEHARGSHNHDVNRDRVLARLTPA